MLCKPLILLLYLVLKVETALLQW